MSIEVKPREILFSVMIMSFMVGIGVWLQNIVLKSEYEKNMEVISSVKVNTPDEFSYIKRTDVGRFIAEGSITPVKPVSISDIDGEYMTIRKTTERYTHHTRIVHVRVGKSTVPQIQHYWTWDVIHTDDFNPDSVIFLGQRIVFNDVRLHIDEKHVATINESNNIRYIYHVRQLSTDGAMTGICENKSYNNLSFKEGKTIEGIIKSSENKSTIMTALFWILWNILMAGVIFLFYSLENEWLEDKKIK